VSIVDGKFAIDLSKKKTYRGGMPGLRAAFRLSITPTTTADFPSLFKNSVPLDSGYQQVISLSIGGF